MLRNITCLVLLITSTLGTGCANDDAGSAAIPPELEPPGTTPTIEEADLYRLDGDRLYVHSARSGLSIVDVSRPSHPRMMGRVGLSGAAGEIYTRGDQAIVLLEGATAACQMPRGLQAGGWQPGTEIVFVDVADAQRPRELYRFCLVGELVASRTLDDILLVVTTGGSGARVLSLDISVPERTCLVQQLSLGKEAQEIHLTPTTLFVAGAVQSDQPRWNGAGWVVDQRSGTRVQMIEVSAASGALRPRGAIIVEGEPQGRFHMQAFGDQFRIVTFDPAQRASRLSVIDLSNPDALTLIGELEGIGHGERLYATRFTDDGARAYVVTFRNTDPLWVIDLADPRQPQIVGALQVPGWSDFIFPRGDKLLTVGRGDRGRGLGISLFDVSDPSRPQTLHQLQLGDAGTQSEANTDHRAVTVLEIGARPLVIVPHTTVHYAKCEAQSALTLVEIAEDWLIRRGSLQQQGLVQRTLLVGDSLLSISDTELLAIDIDDRDLPRVDSQLPLGGPLDDDGLCRYDHGVWLGDDMEEQRMLCSLGRRAGAPPVCWLALLALLAWRRKGGSSRR